MSTEPTTYLLDKKVKREAYTVFKEMGLKPAQAINMFLSQVAQKSGMPFELAGSLPNAKTLHAFEESNEIDKLPTYATFADLRDDLGV